MNGWLSPDGIFYPCERLEHIRDGQIIAKNIYGKSGSVFSLEINKWIKVTATPTSKILLFVYGCAGEMDLISQKQTDFIFDKFINGDILEYEYFYCGSAYQFEKYKQI